MCHLGKLGKVRITALPATCESTVVWLEIRGSSLENRSRARSGEFVLLFRPDKLMKLFFREIIQHQIQTGQ